MISVNSIIKREKATDGGRIGGFFRFTKNGRIYGISCNHVIANINECSVGDVLTDENDKPIGVLSHWLILDDQIHNRAEFALFKPNTTDLAWKQNDPGYKPEGFIAASLNDTVSFTKGTMTAKGTITDVNHKVFITWNDLQYQFTCIEVDAGELGFSSPGDSGGAVFVGDDLLGIILGISEDGSKTYVVPYVGGILSFVALILAMRPKIVGDDVF